MKRIIYTFLASISISLIIISCDYDPRLYPGDPVLAYFTNTSRSLDVIINEQADIEIQLGVSTLSDQDRTVVLALNDDTTADPSQYNLSSFEVTIPAGSYFGTFTVTGIDDTTLPTTGVNLVLDIVTLDGANPGVSDPITLRISKICPVPETYFTGDYLIEQLTPSNPDNISSNSFAMFNTQVVEIVKTSDSGREFSAVYLEDVGIGNAPTTVPFLLLCDEIIVSNVNTNLLCVQGDPVIDLGPPEVPSTYDVSDDSVIEITITEYFSQSGGCSIAGPYDTTFRFTKQ